MTNATPPTPEPTITDVLRRLDSLDQANVIRRIDELDHKIDTFKIQLEAYEKGMRWVVNLAFGLIASATITVLLSTIFGK